VAGLHVGALAFLVYWIGRKLRLSRVLAAVILLGTLLAYVAVVEQRAPVLRAGLMAGIVVLASLFYRRLEVLNSAGLAGVILLVAKPQKLLDTSFQFSFLAIGCIAGIAVPWLERHVQPYVRALEGWRDVTRDGAFSARQVQFRMDLRDVAHGLGAWSGKVASGEWREEGRKKKNETQRRSGRREEKIRTRRAKRKAKIENRKWKMGRAEGHRKTRGRAARLRRRALQTREEDGWKSACRRGCGGDCGE